MSYRVLTTKITNKITEEQLNFLRYTTSLNKEQLEALSNLFLKYSSSKRIKKVEFIVLIKNELKTNKLKDEFIGDAFCMIDVKNSGFLSFEKFVLAFYFLLLDNSKQRSNFLLKAFELDEEDRVYRNDLLYLLRYGLNLENSKEITKYIINHYAIIEDSKRKNLFFSKYFKQKEYIELSKLLEIFSTDKSVKNLVKSGQTLKKHKCKNSTLFKLRPLKSPYL